MSFPKPILEVARERVPDSPVTRDRFVPFSDVEVWLMWQTLEWFVPIEPGQRPAHADLVNEVRTEHKRRLLLQGPSGAKIPVPHTGGSQ